MRVFGRARPESPASFLFIGPPGGWWDREWSTKETFAGGETKVRAVNVHAPK